MSRIITALRAPAADRTTVQLIRYGVVAGLGYLLAIVLYAAEIALGINAYLAFGATFVLNGLFNFSLLRIWAFPPSGRSMISDLRRFCVVAGASFLVNYASFALLYSVIGLIATTSQRLAIVIAAPVTFLANRLWSFRARASTEDTQLGKDEAAASARNASYSRI